MAYAGTASGRGGQPSSSGHHHILLSIMPVIERTFGLADCLLSCFRWLQYFRVLPHLEHHPDRPLWQLTPDIPCHISLSSILPSNNRSFRRSEDVSARYFSRSVDSERELSRGGAYLRSMTARSRWCSKCGWVMGATALRQCRWAGVLGSGLWVSLSGLRAHRSR